MAGGGEWLEQRVMCATHRRAATRCDRVAAFEPRQVLERGERPPPRRRRRRLTSSPPPREVGLARRGFRHVCM